MTASHVKARRVKGFWSRVMRWYKPARARKERAKVREALQKLSPDEAGPNHELNPFDLWDVD